MNYNLVGQRIITAVLMTIAVMMTTNPSYGTELEVKNSNIFLNQCNCLRVLMG